jgi:hypothetical protein
MPKEKFEDGFEVYIYTRDEHPPPHVHVIKAEGEVIIDLGLNGADPELFEIFDMSNKDVRKAKKIVKKYNEFLIERWNFWWAKRHG